MNPIESVSINIIMNQKLSNEYKPDWDIHTLLRHPYAHAYAHHRLPPTFSLFCTIPMNTKRPNHPFNHKKKQ